MHPDADYLKELENLSIELEKKIGKIILSSNQTLIWETVRSVEYKNSIMGYGKLLRD